MRRLSSVGHPMARIGRVLVAVVVVLGVISGGAARILEDDRVFDRSRTVRVRALLCDGQSCDQQNVPNYLQNFADRLKNTNGGGDDQESGGAASSDSNPAQNPNPNPDQNQNQNQGSDQWNSEQQSNSSDQDQSQEGSNPDTGQHQTNDNGSGESGVSEPGAPHAAWAQQRPVGWESGSGNDQQGGNWGVNMLDAAGKPQEPNPHDGGSDLRDGAGMPIILSARSAGGDCGLFGQRHPGEFTPCPQPNLG